MGSCNGALFRFEGATEAETAERKILLAAREEETELSKLNGKRQLRQVRQLYNQQARQCEGLQLPSQQNDENQLRRKEEKPQQPWDSVYLVRLQQEQQQKEKRWGGPVAQFSRQGQQQPGELPRETRQKQQWWPGEGRSARAHVNEDQQEQKQRWQQQACPGGNGKQELPEKRFVCSLSGKSHASLFYNCVFSCFQPSQTRSAGWLRLLLILIAISLSFSLHGRAGAPAGSRKSRCNSCSVCKTHGSFDPSIIASPTMELAAAGRAKERNAWTAGQRAAATTSAGFENGPIKTATTGRATLLRALAAPGDSVAAQGRRLKANFASAKAGGKTAERVQGAASATDCTRVMQSSTAAAAEAARSGGAPEILEEALNLAAEKATGRPCQPPAALLLTGVEAAKRQLSSLPLEEKKGRFQYTSGRERISAIPPLIWNSSAVGRPFAASLVASCSCCISVPSANHSARATTVAARKLFLHCSCGTSGLSRLPFLASPECCASAIFCRKPVTAASSSCCPLLSASPPRTYCSSSSCCTIPTALLRLLRTSLSCISPRTVILTPFFLHSSTRCGFRRQQRDGAASVAAAGTFLPWASSLRLSSLPCSACTATGGFHASSCSFFSLYAERCVLPQLRAAASSVEGEAISTNFQFIRFCASSTSCFQSLMSFVPAPDAASSFRHGNCSRLLLSGESVLSFCKTHSIGAAFASDVFSPCLSGCCFRRHLHHPVFCSSSNAASSFPNSASSEHRPAFSTTSYCICSTLLVGSSPPYASFSLVSKQRLCAFWSSLPPSRYIDQRRRLHLLPRKNPLWKRLRLAIRPVYNSVPSALLSCSSNPPYSRCASPFSLLRLKPFLRLFPPHKAGRPVTTSFLYSRERPAFRNSDCLPAAVQAGRIFAFLRCVSPSCSSWFDPPYKTYSPPASPLNTTARRRSISRPSRLSFASRFAPPLVCCSSPSPLPLFSPLLFPPRLTVRRLFRGDLSSMGRTGTSSHSTIWPSLPSSLSNSGSFSASALSPFRSTVLLPPLSSSFSTISTRLPTHAPLAFVARPFPVLILTFSSPRIFLSAGSLRRCITSRCPPVLPSSPRDNFSTHASPSLRLPVCCCIPSCPTSPLSSLQRHYSLSHACTSLRDLLRCLITSPPHCSSPRRDSPTPASPPLPESLSCYIPSRPFHSLTSLRRHGYPVHASFPLSSSPVLRAAPALYRLSIFRRSQHCSAIRQPASPFSCCTASCAGICLLRTEKKETGAAAGITSALTSVAHFTTQCASHRSSTLKLCLLERSPRQAWVVFLPRRLSPVLPEWQLRQQASMSLLHAGMCATSRTASDNEWQQLCSYGTPRNLCSHPMQVQRNTAVKAFATGGGEEGGGQRSRGRYQQGCQENSSSVAQESSDFPVENGDGGCVLCAEGGGGQRKEAALRSGTQQVGEVQKTEKETAAAVGGLHTAGIEADISGAEHPVRAVAARHNEEKAAAAAAERLLSDTRFFLSTNCSGERERNMAVEGGVVFSGGKHETPPSSLSVSSEISLVKNLQFSRCGGVKSRRHIGERRRLDRRLNWFKQYPYAPEHPAPPKAKRGAKLTANLPKIISLKNPPLPPRTLPSSLRWKQLADSVAPAAAAAAAAAATKAAMEVLERTATSAGRKKSRKRRTKQALARAAVAAAAAAQQAPGSAALTAAAAWLQSAQLEMTAQEKEKEKEATRAASCEVAWGAHSAGATADVSVEALPFSRAPSSAEGIYSAAAVIPIVGRRKEAAAREVDCRHPVVEGRDAEKVVSSTEEIDPARVLLSKQKGTKNGLQGELGDVEHGADRQQGRTVAADTKEDHCPSLLSLLYPSKHAAYPPQLAFFVMKQLATTKFNESVELHVQLNLGSGPRGKARMSGATLGRMRGYVTLPRGQLGELARLARRRQLELQYAGDEERYTQMKQQKITETEQADPRQTFPPNDTEKRVEQHAEAPWQTKQNMLISQEVAGAMRRQVTTGSTKGGQPQPEDAPRSAEERQERRDMLVTSGGLRFASSANTPLTDCLVKEESGIIRGRKRGSIWRRQRVIAAYVDRADEEAARQAGADIVGAERVLSLVRNDAISFDVLISTPDMVARLTRYGKILGPKDLLPQEAWGTLNADFCGAIRLYRQPTIAYKSDKFNIVHLSIGHASMPTQHLVENLEAAVASLQSRKPPSAGLNFFNKVHISSTMGPGILIDMKHVKLTAGGARRVR